MFAFPSSSSLFIFSVYPHLTHLSIDQNMEEATGTLDESIGILTRAQNKFKSKRSLIIKIFLAILVFLLLFGLFLR